MPMPPNGTKAGNSPQSDPEIIRLTEERSLTAAELGMLAGLIAEERDYYTILGVDRAASREEINRAYCIAVHSFHPAMRRQLTQSDNVLHWKLSCALKRIEKAYSILSSRVRRQVYDDSLSRQLASFMKEAIIGNLESADATETHRASEGLGHGVFGYDRSRERRRVERIPLRIPALVCLDHHWQETTESEDVSPLGIRIQLSRAVEPGTLLSLALPMPGDLRTRDCDDEVYAVNGFAIRSVQIDSKRLIAVEFV